MKRDPFDFFWKVFPWFFGFVAVLALGTIVLQMWALYSVATNPQEAGEFVGKIIRGVITETTR